MGVDPRQRVTCGEAVVAMILNALGFVDRPLYLFPEYSGRFFHNNTTSISLQGEYEHEEGDIDAVPIQITHGYSMDHRPDLKQFVISLVMSDSLPVFIQALSGNTPDIREKFLRATSG